jgi:hypothetical protein
MAAGQNHPRLENCHLNLLDHCLGHCLDSYSDQRALGYCRHPYRLDHQAFAFHPQRFPLCNAFVRLVPTRGFGARLPILEPRFRYSLAISAKRLKKTTRCHSVRSFCSPESRSRQAFDVATDTLVTAPPEGKYRVSGSLPRLPTMITLLMPLAITTPLRRPTILNCRDYRILCSAL